MNYQNQKMDEFVLDKYSLNFLNNNSRYMRYHILSESESERLRVIENKFGISDIYFASI